MRRIGSDKRPSRGQALIEFALILPLLFLLIVNVINFGGFFYAWIVVSGAARTGAQYMAMGGASVNAPAPASITAVQTLVTNDLSALPNRASAQVCVSTSTSPTVSCTSGAAPAGAPPAADTPEGNPAITYVIGAVDVTYTYQPFIPLGDFGVAHIHATLATTNIHRQSQMRILQ